jgi:hypothetical protein
MLFVLTGFRQEKEFRVFGFEGVAAGKPRSAHTVRADLSLIRRHGIQIQELPLLCRGLLEQASTAGNVQALTFTEECMREHASHRAARLAEAQARKPKRTLPVNHLGGGWRARQF